MNQNLRQEILKLKSERNAVILAHYYQESEIQDLADVLGDSLALAQAAQKSDADVICFCGVHFMAETAKILNPSKTVVLPDLKAGCSLADSCPAKMLAEWKKNHPEHYIISYINCSAEVKALSDVICTSSNAKKILEAAPKDRAVLFGPDKNLGNWLKTQTGREFDVWPGACHVHEAFRAETILNLKLEHPEALFICHPECEEPVRFHADFIGSTSALLKFTQTSPAKKFIVGTEVGIIHQMEKASPEKTFVPAPGTDKGCNCNICPYMKMNTLEKVRDCLKNLEPQIRMDEALRVRALKPLQRMLELS